VPEAIFELANENTPVCLKNLYCSTVSKPVHVNLTLNVASILKLRPFLEMLIISRFFITLWQRVKGQCIFFLLQSGKYEFSRVLFDHVHEPRKEPLLLAKALVTYLTAIVEVFADYIDLFSKRLTTFSRTLNLCRRTILLSMHHSVRIIEMSRFA
jgi:hypothetical protein